jgi:hypothetical protein
MKDLTENEIRKYLEFAVKDLAAKNFKQGQTELIGQAVLDSQLLRRISPKMLTGLDDGISVENILLSLWVSAFQMGRECESRLRKDHD